MRTPAARTPRKGASRRAAVEGEEARDAAALIVTRVAEEGETLGAALEAFDPRLDGRDAALARAIARVTLRRRGDVDWCLGELMERPLPKRAGAVRSVLRVSAAQLLFMRQADHAAVNVAVELLKGDQDTAGFAGLANAVLRRLIRERDELLSRLPVAANTPAWLWRRWVAAWGPEAAAAIAAAHRDEPALDLCFASPDVPRPDGAVALPAGGARVPVGSVIDIEGYAEGGWWVQDAAAQLPALLLGDVAGHSVLDMCAAPGGKTMQLAAAGAHVTALELDPARAARLTENLERTRLAERVKVVVGDALRAEGQYDAVLLDAPCSATGTLRRQPDVAWAKRETDIASLVALQQKLLSRAARCVRPGGALVYATCSIEPAEGEAQLKFVAASLPELRLVAVTDGPAFPYADATGAVRTLPFMPAGDATGLDGFFAARFCRE